MDENEVEAVEAPVEELPDENVEPLEELPDVNLLEDELPSIDAMKAALDVDGKESFSISKEELDALPHAAKRMVYNLRKDYLAKTREISESRKTFSQKEQALKDLRLTVQEERAKLYSGMLPLADMFKPPEGDAPPDRFSDEGFDWHVQKRLSSSMGAFFTKLQESSSAADAEVQEKLEEVRVARETEALKGFVEENNDWWTGNRDLVKRLVDGGMHWKEAVETLQSRMAPPAPDEPDPEEERRLTREKSRKLAGGTSKMPGRRVAENLSYRGKR